VVPLEEMSVLVQEESPGRVHVEPVKPLEQMQRQEPETRMLVPPWAQGAAEVQEERLEAAVGELLLGRTMRVTGMMTAAAMRRMRMMVRRTKAQMGMPQHLRERCFSS